MANMTRFALAGVCCLVASVLAQPGGGDGLKVLSYGDLGAQVRSYKGKVVVVYFWSFG